MTFRRLCSQPNVVLDLMHLLHLSQRNLDSSAFIGQEFSSRDRWNIIYLISNRRQLGKFWIQCTWFAWLCLTGRIVSNKSKHPKITKEIHWDARKHLIENRPIMALSPDWGGDNTDLLGLLVIIEVIVNHNNNRPRSHPSSRKDRNNS